ncbi:hypothetical protein [Tenacibaculum ovolyticum]|uniref:hypothetical protein n=2 Tax=Tenacibaculum ovolyticum TaxID=104270 RepID=UPI001F42C8AF|nr:hypothetical protein [Tenacibaculum ovolyticum]
MRNYNIYIFLIIFFICCKNSITTCSNANLNKKIIILGFPITTGIKSFDATIYEIKEGMLPRKIRIEDIYFSNEKYHYLNIKLNEDLFASNTYQLNLNDTLKYRISEIKTFSEVRMIGIREDSICKTKSFKINNKIAETFFTTGINFKIPK